MGKRTVVQLAATMHSTTMYSLDQISVCNAHTILRNACMSAGLEKEKTLLLVEASFESHTHSYWKQLLEIMRDGVLVDIYMYMYMYFIPYTVHVHMCTCTCTVYFSRAQYTIDFHYFGI